MIVEFILPIVFSILIIIKIYGILILIKPPRRINSFYGYSSRRARTNQSTWDFAQRIEKKILITVLLLFVSSFSLILILFSHFDWGIATLLMYFIVMAIIETTIIISSHLVIENRLKSMINLEEQ